MIALAALVATASAQQDIGESELEDLLRVKI